MCDVPDPKVLIYFIMAFAFIFMEAMLLVVISFKKAWETVYTKIVKVDVLIIILALVVSAFIMYKGPTC
jgi:hypothetical protein